MLEAKLRHQSFIRQRPTTLASYLRRRKFYNTGHWAFMPIVDYFIEYESQLNSETSTSILSDEITGLSIFDRSHLDRLGKICRYLIRSSETGLLQLQTSLLSINAKNGLI